MLFTLCSYVSIVLLLIQYYQHIVEIFCYLNAQVSGYADI